MAMRTASPWWASLAFASGLLFLLLGERFFGHLSGARFVLTGMGLVLIVGITATRAWTMLGSAGARRRVERTLLVCNAGTVFALILYLLSTDWGIAKLGLVDPAATHFRGAMTVVFLVVLVASIVPLIMVELSLGVALRGRFDVQAGPGNEEAGVEYFRVREIGWSGLSVGLALAFLMVTCQVASERNVQRDVSYFKTSSPGESTQKIIETSSDPVRVLLFFPEVNEVKEQVKRYFESLASRFPRKLIVEEYDRLTAAELSGKYKVTKDGTVVFVRGAGDKEKSQIMDIDTDVTKFKLSTSKLRNLDREVNAVLLRLMRDKRKAYLVIGHGELNDPDSVPAEMRNADRSTTVLKKRLADLNYEMKNLGLMDLSKDVPEDATVVLLLGPSVPLQAGEWASLSRYLDRGGRLLIALDPRGDTSMGPLEGRFAFRMYPGNLTDEEKFMPRLRQLQDRRTVLSNQFSAHASTTSLSRGGAERPLILNDAGALEDMPYTGKSSEAPKKTITIRSMESSFLDRNNNYAFDAAGEIPEKKQRWNLAAAVEGPKVGDKEGYRALLFADVDLFSDLFGRDQLGRKIAIMYSDYAGTLLDDSVKWLGGEEAIVGEVVSEDDKPIQHTKNADAVWFTLMIIGAPILVLTLGLIGTWARRRRGSKKTEVTQ